MLASTKKMFTSVRHASIKQTAPYWSPAFSRVIYYGICCCCSFTILKEQELEVFFLPPISACTMCCNNGTIAIESLQLNRVKDLECQINAVFGCQIYSMR